MVVDPLEMVETMALVDMADEAVVSVRVEVYET